MVVVYTLVNNSHNNIAATRCELPRGESSSHLSCGERLLLRCDGNAQNSFPTQQGKDPSSRATRWKRGSSGCGRDPRDSSRVETGMSGNFLSCRKGVKDFWKFQMLGVISLEKPQRKWASSRLEGKT